MKELSGSTGSTVSNIWNEYILLRIPIKRYYIGSAVAFLGKDLLVWFHKIQA